MQTVKKFDVMVAGNLFIDVVMSGFPFWPEPGQEVAANYYCREVGRGASITAAGLAKLGASAATLRVVGRDGQCLVKRLRRHNVAYRGFVIAVTACRRTAFIAVLEESPALARLAMLQYPIIGQWKLASEPCGALIESDPGLGRLR